MIKSLIIDLDSANPIATDLITNLPNPESLAINGNDILYIAESNRIIKVDLTASTPISTDVIVGLADTPTGLLFNGNDLYISFTFANKISKIDVTESTPILIDVISTTLPRGMAMNGNELYYTTNSGISKIDITENTPTVTSIVSGLNSAHNIVINGNELFITENSGNKVSKINIAENNPTVIDIITGLSGPTGIAIYNNTLYISELFAHKIIKLDDTLSIKDQEIISNTLIAFPNPTKDMVEISGLVNNENYTIYNAFGQEVIKRDIVQKANIDLSYLANGVYFLKTDKGKTIRIVKK